MRIGIHARGVVHQRSIEDHLSGRRTAVEHHAVSIILNRNRRRSVTEGVIAAGGVVERQLRLFADNEVSTAGDIPVDGKRTRLGDRHAGVVHQRLSKHHIVAGNEFISAVENQFAIGGRAAGGEDVLPVGISVIIINRGIGRGNRTAAFGHIVEVQRLVRGNRNTAVTGNRAPDFSLLAAAVFTGDVEIDRAGLTHAQHGIDRSGIRRGAGAVAIIFIEVTAGEVHRTGHRQRHAFVAERTGHGRRVGSHQSDHIRSGRAGRNRRIAADREIDQRTAEDRLTGRIDDSGGDTIYHPGVGCGVEHRLRIGGIRCGNAGIDRSDHPIAVIIERNNRILALIRGNLHGRIIGEESVGNNDAADAPVIVIIEINRGAAAVAVEVVRHGAGTGHGKSTGTGRNIVEEEITFAVEDTGVMNLAVEVDIAPKACGNRTGIDDLREVQRRILTDGDLTARHVTDTDLIGQVAVQIQDSGVHKEDVSRRGIEHVEETNALGTAGDAQRSGVGQSFVEDHAFGIDVDRTGVVEIPEDRSGRIIAEFNLALVDQRVEDRSITDRDCTI